MIKAVLILYAGADLVMWRLQSSLCVEAPVVED